MTAHVFSVDVEDWFHANALEPWAPRSRWDTLEHRVQESTDRMLGLLDRHGVRGTFFTLGWVAERWPGLIRRIADGGHEVASHGWWHRRVTTLTREQFRDDVRAARAILEELSGQPVLGFRAPSFSVRPGMEWVFDVLLEEGYAYDSSLFPIRRPGYGWPGAPTTAHRIERPGGTLLELPLATLPLAGARLPAAGGGYLRQFPFALTERAFARATQRGEPAMFYTHPWEADPGQPRLPLPWLTRVRHYRGLERTEALLDRLLARFRFVPAVEAHAVARPAVERREWAVPVLT